MNAKRATVPDIVQATADFEKWAARHVNLIPFDVRRKHKFMATAPFPFLRATFYRWAQRWPEICPELAHAPKVLAIGDLHIENFGTWRDFEGRLIWGVNDFDEAWPASYAVDLVRLLTSAYMGIEANHLSLSRKQARRAIEEGYRDCLKQGGSAFILAERHQWLRLIALSELRDPVIFWKRILNCAPYKGKLPKDVWQQIYDTMPIHAVHYELKSRIAGLGSLGHPRVLALAEWDRAHVVREAKQLTPSAWIWTHGLQTSKVLGPELVKRAVRIPDPHLRFTEHWLVRRLAPDCCHIEIQSMPEKRDEERLLYCMGWETANIHFGSPRAIAAVKRDIARRKGRWLHKAAKLMLKSTLDDWKTWRRTWLRQPDRTK